ncbi:MAG: gamma-glutamylcyclotransferase [Rhodospirillales bacterium]|nr:gamma-glutamylcyclotransferase [Rhodospirillales bacterium]
MRLAGPCSEVMDYFFYGTLQDNEVLEPVLGRPVPDSAKDVAELAGYIRVRGQGVTYPVVMPVPDARVVGILVTGIESGEADRLAAFEGPGYDQRTVDVVGKRRGVVAALIFVPNLSVLGASQEPWSLDDWRRRHKSRYLEDVRSWVKAWRSGTT